jgi:FeS assembly SUF system protein
MPITITEKAAAEVNRIIGEQQAADPMLGKIYLRLRIVGGGHSGIQHKLDLDPIVDLKRDELFEFHGIPTAVDKRSLIYLENAKVDFHDNTNRRGFSVSSGINTGASRPPASAAPQSESALEESVVAALRTVFDPEIPVNIYDLGLIYDLKIDPSGAVSIRMTLTSPACPVAGSLPGQVQARVQDVSGVASAKVELVWDPPWSMSRMSEEARLQLGMFD